MSSSRPFVSQALMGEKRVRNCGLLLDDFDGDFLFRAVGFCLTNFTCTGVTGLGSIEIGVCRAPLIDPFKESSDPLVGLGSPVICVLKTQLACSMGGFSNKGDVGSSDRCFIACVR